MRKLQRKSQTGIAMMMAIVTMVILGALAADLVYQMGVYTSVVFNQRDKYQASLLAKSAVKLALMQIRVTDKIKKKAKELGAPEGEADKIWQTPLILPVPTAAGSTAIEKDALTEFNKALGFNGTLSITIQGENNKLNVNNLVWISPDQATKAESGGAATGGTRIGTPAAGGTKLTPEKKAEIQKTVRQNFAEVFDQLIVKKRKDDKTFLDKYPNLQADPLIGNLIAFMSPDVQTDGDGREKNEYYRALDPPRNPKEAPLVAESELYLVKGFTDDLVNLFTEAFTIQNTSSIDVNEASKKLLNALIPELNDDNLEALEKHKKEVGDFAKAEDFWKFLKEELRLGDVDEIRKRLDTKGIKILEKQTSFRVLISTKSGLATTNWVAQIGLGAPAVDMPEKSAEPSKATSPAIDGSIDDGAAAAEANKKNKDSKDQGKDGDLVPNIIYLKAD